MGALTGLRVLDLSRVLAGPWATQSLADLGAEVIKIERPGQGDDTRAWGPPYMRDAAGHDTTEAAYYLSTNRNKQSVTLDMSTAEGQRLIRALAMKSDIVVENFKVGGLKQYGLDYESLSAANPRLIYCSITGFGQTGPYANRAGYDYLIQALGGLMSVTGRADDEAGAGPVKVGVALVDILTGLYATIGVLAAVEARHTTGRGQHIDMALLDVQVACLANQALNFLTTGRAPKRLGNGHPNIVPYQDFPTADGEMILAIGNDAQFKKFCAVAGHAELADDARFATNANRVKHRKELIPLLRRITVMQSTNEWITLLESHAVPCGPINDLAAVFADPHVIARGLKLDLPHVLGSAPSVASPLRLSDTPVNYHHGPPVLGEHTEAVLRDALGLTVAEIAALKSARVI